MLKIRPEPCLCCILGLWFNETGSHWVAAAGLKLSAFLPILLEGCNFVKSMVDILHFFFYFGKSTKSIGDKGLEEIRVSRLCFPAAENPNISRDAERPLSLKHWPVRRQPPCDILCSLTLLSWSYLVLHRPLRSGWTLCLQLPLQEKLAPLHPKLWLVWRLLKEKSTWFLK